MAEVIEVATRLRQNDVTVDWLTLDGAVIVDASGLTLSPTHSVPEVSATDIDVLIVPGGDPESIIGNDEAQQLVTRVAAAGVVAGICGGVLPLADAGVLRGHRATHTYRPPWAPSDVAEFVRPLFEGVDIEADRSVGVVVDRSIITALPNATAEFSTAICHRIGLYDKDRAALLTRHLQGEYVPALLTSDSASAFRVEVREASVDDIDSLVRLQIRLFDEDAVVHERLADASWPRREGRRDFEQLLDSATSIVFIAVGATGPIGFIVGYLADSSPTRKPARYAVLRSLYVEPDARDSGCGAALTERFLAWARASAAAEAHVSAYAANRSAHRFYERFGFLSQSTLRVLPLPDNAGPEG